MQIAMPMDLHDKAVVPTEAKKQVSNSMDAMIRIQCNEWMRRDENLENEKLEIWVSVAWNPRCPYSSVLVHDVVGSLSLSYDDNDGHGTR